MTNYYGDEIVYDTIGNPIRIGMYDSDFDIWYAGYEPEWNGRQLTSYRDFMEDDGIFYGSTYTYQYNADGIRTSKTVNGVEHKYYLNGSQILAETWTQNGVEHLLIFVYDENGSPIALKYRTNAYAENTFDFFFYEKNLQGDIIGVYNVNGRKIGTYVYDAWGVCSTYVASSTSTLEQSIVRPYNPYRYRGYYYDTETQLYYLQSRYYNPTWGRFINEDNYISTGTGILGYNMFAYCNNNPINHIDYYGTSWKDFWEDLKEFGEECIKAAAVVGAIGSAVAIVGASIGGTVMSGGAAAATIPAALVVATECLGAAVAVVGAVGVVSVATAEVGISFSNSKNPNHIGKHKGDSTYNDGTTHIDYEVYGEGSGNGNVHLQQGKAKHKLFELRNHVPHRIPATKSIQRMIDRNPKIRYAIDKAIDYVISLGG